MNPQMEIPRPLETLIIKLDVRIQLLLGRLKILLIILPALEHGFGAEIREVGVVDLCVPQTGVVQDLQFRLVAPGEIGEVFVVGGVDAREVGFVGAVAEVVPRGGGQGEFDVFVFFNGQDGLEELEFGEEGRCARVREFARGDGDLVGDGFFVHEGFDIWVSSISISIIEAGEKG